MTLIAGMQFQDGVAVAGDTRVTVSSATGEVIRAWDNAQKVYFLPPFVIGISGDIQAAACVLGGYLETVFDPSQKESLETKALDPEWVKNCFTSLYEKAIKNLGRKGFPQVGLLLASCGRKVTSRPPPRDEAITVSTPALEDAAKHYYAADKETASLLISLELPNLRARIAEAGGVLLMGSGRLIDTILRQHVAFYLVPKHGSLRTRVSLTIRGFSTLSKGDPTFNNLVHTIILDSSQVDYLGSAHNEAALEHRLKLEDGGTAVPLEAEDKRPEFAAMGAGGVFFRETLFDGRSWWVYDYRTNRKFQLLDILLEYGRDSPQWGTGFLHARNI